jgi:hypothetical protein
MEHHPAPDSALGTLVAKDEAIGAQHVHRLA